MTKCKRAGITPMFFDQKKSLGYIKRCQSIIDIFIELYALKLCKNVDHQMSNVRLTKQEKYRLHT
jgi:hypothetical protein